MSVPPAWDVPPQASGIYVPQPQVRPLDFEVVSTAPLVLKDLDERKKCNDREYTGWDGGMSCWVIYR